MQVKHNDHDKSRHVVVETGSNVSVVNNSVNQSHLAINNLNLDMNELKISKFMKKNSDCTVYENASRKVVTTYYFCACDPNQMDQICSACATNCHKGPGHKLSIGHNGPIVCQCGIKCHKVDEYTSTLVKKTCLFAEFSRVSKLNVFYENSQGLKICMFCINFCCKDLKTRHKDDFEKKISGNNNDVFAECQCDNSDHNDLKFVFSNTNNFCKKTTNFENLSPNHILNLIFLSKNSFQLHYSNFVSYYDKIIERMKDIDDFEFDKKIYISNFYWAVMGFSTIAKLSKFQSYFLKEIRDYFSIDFTIQAIEFSNEDSKPLWMSLNNLLTCFTKITLNYYMRAFPKVKIIDFGNLNPLQRLMIVSNVKKNTVFMNNFIEGKNFIDVILNSMQKINSMKFVNIEGYDVLIMYAGILKKFARYYLFDTDQILKYCSIIDTLILNTKGFSHRNKNKEEKFTLEKRKKEIELLIKITKSLLFFAISYNDNMIYKNND